MAGIGKKILKKRREFILCFFLFIYFFLLINNINGINLLIGDESGNSSIVLQLIKGFVAPNNQPVLAKTIWYYFVFLFSAITGTYSPFIWRSGTIFLSLGCLLVFYGIARHFFTKLIAFLATVVLAIDPMYFAMSRLMELDVPQLFFILCSVYSLLKFLKTKKNQWFLACGFLLGLSLATKTSGFLCVITFPLLINLYQDHRKKSKHDVIQSWILCQIKFLCVTTLGFFIGNAILFTKVPVPGAFELYKFLIFSQFEKHTALSGNYLSSPVWSWFLIPQIELLYRIFLEKNSLKTIYVFVNPITTFTFWINMIIVPFLIFTRKLKNRYVPIILVIILSLYLPWFFSSSLAFYYSVLPIIPFAIILLFELLSCLKNKVFAYGFLLIVSSAIFSLYYPVLIGKAVSLRYDSFLFSFSKYRFGSVNILFCQYCSPHTKSSSPLK